MSKAYITREEKEKRSKEEIQKRADEWLRQAMVLKLEEKEPRKR